MKQPPRKPHRKDHTGYAWDGNSILPLAFLVDVDGTLASLPIETESGRQRYLRPSAVEALRLMSSQAPVFLWSMAGPENGMRLADEFPIIRPFISGFFHKDDFPLHLIMHPIAIDDEGVCRPDAPHLQDVYVIPAYEGGNGDEVFQALVTELCQDLAGE